MLKKQITSLVLALGLALGSAASAFAADEFFSVGVSVPNKVVIDDGEGSETADSVSGQFVWVKLPFLLGLGYESYDFTLADSAGDFTTEVSAFDVFYQFPIPLVNFSLGYAMGTTTTAGDLDVFFDGDTATGWFWRFGIPLGMFDLHVSQHNMSSKLKGKNYDFGGFTLKADDLDWNFKTTAIGLSFGF